MNYYFEKKIIFVNEKINPRLWYYIGFSNRLVRGGEEKVIWPMRLFEWDAWIVLRS
jgi:hypothetical protein